MMVVSDLCAKPQESFSKGLSLAMPPRKKVKGGALAQAFAAGASTPVAASSLDALHQVQRDCMQIVEDIFALRHCTISDVHSEPQGLLTPGIDGLFPWPVTFGGTFKDIAQRAFRDAERLVSMSSEFAFNVGMLEVQDDAEFLQHFCKLDVAWMS